MDDLSAEAHREHAHTIDSLIAALEELKKHGTPGDTVVVLAKDAEGNGFSPLTRHENVHDAMYAPESTWSGEHFMTEEYRQSMDDPDDYTPAPDGAFLAVFLWPTN